MLEKHFQQAVVGIAHLGGWLVHHTRTVRIHGGGWTSPGIDLGFPDLVLCHRQHGVIFCELKTDTGQLSINQRKWRKHIEEAGARYELWRPRDMDTIRRTLLASVQSK